MTLEGQTPSVTTETAKVSDQVTAALVDAQLDAEVDEVLQLAAQSPNAALIQLGSLIERRLRGRVIEGTDRPISVPSRIRFFQRVGTLSPQVADTVLAFWTLRKRVLHEGHATNQEALRAVDVGLELLRILYARPLV